MSRSSEGNWRKNALPTTWRKAELIQRLYKFTKRELITSQGGSPEDSARSEKSQDKVESMLKTPSRISRLLPNIEEINRSARSRLDTMSSSWEHSGQTTKTGQLSNTEPPRYQFSSDEPKYNTDDRECEFSGDVGDNTEITNVEKSMILIVFCKKLVK